MNQNIKRLKDIGCYRGRRHIMVRGRRSPPRWRSPRRAVPALRLQNRLHPLLCGAAPPPPCTVRHTANLRASPPQGLPVRGQRTKTNARTRKGKPKTVAGKKKAVR